MKRTLILLSMLLTAFACYAQESKTERGKRLYLDANDPAIVFIKDKREKLLQDVIACLTGSNSEEHAQAMIQLAKIKADKGEADSTMIYFNRARTTARQLNLPEKELEVLTTLYSIARNAREWPECQRLSLSIDSIANSCSSLMAQVKAIEFKASVAQDDNRMVLAEKFLLQAFRMAGKFEDKMSADRAQSGVLYQLYNLCYHQKKYDKALDYYKKSNDLMLKYDNSIDADKLSLLYFDYLEIYTAMEKKDVCLQYVDSMLALLPDINDAMVRHTVLGESTYVLHHFGEYERAISLLQHTDAETGETRFPEGSNIHELIIATDCLVKLGRNDEAKVLTHRLKNLIDSLPTKSSEGYINTLYQIACYEVRTGDTELGTVHAQESVELAMSLVKSQLRLLSTNKRKTFWQSFSGNLFEAPLFAQETSHSCDAFTRTAYEALLFSKGLLLASERSVAEVIADEGSAADKDLYEKLLRCSAALDALQASESPDMEEMASAYQELIEADNRLADQCAAYASIADFTNTTLGDVQKALGPDDVLIDMTDFKPRTGGHHYAAFIITRDSQYPLLLPLCTGEAIDSVEAGANHIPNLLYQRRHAEALARVTTSALLPHLNERGTIYLVPSGAYHQLSIEALPSPDGKLLGDRYNIVRLSTARELCKNGKTPAAKPTAALYGGLSYDMGAEEMALESARHTIPMMLASRDGDISTLNAFTPLPFTGDEIHAIAGILNGKAETTIYEGNRGSEESFIALSGHAPSIIHLATHGFYYSPEQAHDVAALSGYEDAMNLSGLVMSGGNAGVTGLELHPGTLCGLLTAADIATLDLRGTRLVCLSACHTGKGESTPEGVYGLQRALKKAGAGSILMCLWEASDESTALFMKEFYESYASNGWDSRKAFRQARTALRKEYKSPYYWAGFILLD